jgi:hypothetical protein
MLYLRGEKVCIRFVIFDFWCNEETVKLAPLWFYPWLYCWEGGLNCFSCITYLFLLCLSIIKSAASINLAYYVWHTHTHTHTLSLSHEFWVTNFPSPETVSIVENLQVVYFYKLFTGWINNNNQQAGNMLT